MSNLMSAERRTYLNAILFACLSAVLLIAAGVSFGGINFGSDREFSAVFKASNGLIAGDQVRAAGVPVGRVKDVRLDDQERVVVDFTANDQTPLSASTNAAIRFRSLTGTKLLELSDDGSRSSSLAEGATIPLSQTDSGVDIDAVFDSLRPAIQGLDPGTINEISQSLIRVFSGQTSQITSLLQHLGSVISTLADRNEVIDSLITNWTAVLGTLDEHRDDLDDSVVLLRKLITGLSKQREEIVGSIDSIRVLADESATLIEGVRPGLRRTLLQTLLLTNKVNKELDVVEHYLTIGPEAVRLLGRMASYGSFYGLYVCGASATVTLPGGGEAELTDGYDSAPRCQFEDGTEPLRPQR